MEQIMHSFSPDSLYFASVSGDGLLRVWDVQSSELQGQRPADLADPVTTLVWQDNIDGANSTSANSTKRNKKKKSNVGGIICSQLVLGTHSGKVHLFNISTGVTETLTGGPGSHVTAASWHHSDNVLFSAAQQTIVVWDLSDKSLKDSWAMLDRQTVSALRYVGTVGDANNCLLAAGSHIKLFDVDSHDELKRFSGHEHGVTSLWPLGGLVLSCVQSQPDDLLLNVWALADDGRSAAKQSRTAKFAFSCSSAIKTVQAVLKGDSVRALAVTDNGIVNIFEHEIETKTKKPISPKSKVVIRTPDGTDTLPILAAHFSSTSRVTLCRGSVFAPAFESVAFVDSESGLPIDVELSRAALAGQLVAGGAAAAAAGKAKALAKQSAAATVVLTAAEAAGQQQRKVKKPQKELEPTLAEKVRELQVTSIEGDNRSNGKPKAGSLAQMLAQALHSNDTALLDECLNSTKPAVVRATVARLPTAHVARLLVFVVNRLETKPSRGLSLALWIKTILTTHAAYLMSLPDLADVMSRLCGVVDVRLAAMPRLLKLSGRLDLMLSQIASRGTGADGNSEIQVPLNVYSEPDSDDEIDEHLSVSESDDSEPSDDEESESENEMNGDFDSDNESIDGLAANGHLEMDDDSD